MSKANTAAEQQPNFKFEKRMDFTGKQRISATPTGAWHARQSPLLIVQFLAGFRQFPCLVQPPNEWFLPELAG